LIVLVSGHIARLVRSCLSAGFLFCQLTISLANHQLTLTRYWTTPIAWYVTQRGYRHGRRS